MRESGVLHIRGKEDIEACFTPWQVFSTRPPGPSLFAAATGPGAIKKEENKVFSRITDKFKSNPTMYYAMSITASWAGVGSLMNFRTLAYGTGLIPAIIWGLANSVACVLFGLIAKKLPTVRELMRTRALRYILGFLTLFQCWTNMTGIREVFEDTPLGATGGMVITYAVCIFFIILLLRRGMIRNVLTDSGSWVAVYGLLYLLTILAYIKSGGRVNAVPAGTEWVNMKVGLWKGFLLLPGPFTYAYFFELLDYNDQNSDATKKVDITRSFLFAGLMFGWYMVFSCALALTDFSPVLNVIKAVLITLVAVSSISSFLYSEYLLFGKKLGLAVDIFTVGFWPFVVPLGVMGVWTLMSEIRIYMVAVLLLVALVRRMVLKKRGVTA